MKKASSVCAEASLKETGLKQRFHVFILNNSVGFILVSLNLLQP